jgi:hypothetical protein
MLETLIISVFTLNISLLVTIIARIAKVNQPYMTQNQEELYNYQTNYETQENDWEFKILRTVNDGFQPHKLLKSVCAEESEAGWVLLEKLDNNRLRFRRPIHFREKDHLLKLDPYRSYYGLSPKATNFISIVMILVIMAVPAFFGFAFMQNIFKTLRTQNPQVPAKNTPKPPLIPSVTPPSNIKPNPPKPQ